MLNILHKRLCTVENTGAIVLRFSVTEVLQVGRRGQKSNKQAKGILSEAHVSGVTTQILLISFLLSLQIFSTNLTPETTRLLSSFTKWTKRTLKKIYILLTVLKHGISILKQVENLFRSTLTFQNIISLLKIYEHCFAITDLLLGGKEICQWK